MENSERSVAMDTFTPTLLLTVAKWLDDRLIVPLRYSQKLRITPRGEPYLQASIDDVVPVRGDNEQPYRATVKILDTNPGDDPDIMVQLLPDYGSDHLFEWEILQQRGADWINEVILEDAQADWSDQHRRRR